MSGLLDLKNISPATLEAVQLRYDVHAPQALDIINANCKVLIELYKKKFHRLYWTSEDRETLNVIISNNLVKPGYVSAMIADLEACEAKCKGETKSNLELIDNLGVWLELCFFDQIMPDFRAKVKRVMNTYTKDQLQLLFDLTTLCLQMLLKARNGPLPVPSAKKPFIEHVCYEFLRDADQVYSKMLRHSKISRFNVAQELLASRLSALTSKPSPGPVVTPKKESPPRAAAAAASGQGERLSLPSAVASPSKYQTPEKKRTASAPIPIVQKKKKQQELPSPESCCDEEEEEAVPKKEELKKKPKKVVTLTGDVPARSNNGQKIKSPEKEKITDPIVKKRQQSPAEQEEEDDEEEDDEDDDEEDDEEEDDESDDEEEE